MGNPANVGNWRVCLRKLPDICVRVRAQYAYEAWQAARPELLDAATAAGLVAEVAFADCTYSQVSERKAPRVDAERIHRLVGPEREAFISGSGRA
jgi:hypothetical protein